MSAKATFDFLIGLKSWSARSSFILMRLSQRLGISESVSKRFQEKICGPFSSDAGTYDLRPATLDFVTVHSAFEKETHDALRELFPTRTKGVMLDVGGFCGSFGLRYRNIFEKIFIFEPSPENAAAIIRNISLNGKGVLVQAAAVSSPGKRQLFLGTDDTHSLIQHDQLRSTEVEGVDLDGFLARAGVSDHAVRLLKIDVEGAEVDVLEGAKRILDSFHPIVVAEANSEGERRNIEQFLHRFGYVLDRRCDGRNFLFRPAAPEHSS